MRISIRMVFKILVISRSTEIPIESNVWLGMYYVPYTHNFHDQRLIFFLAEDEDLCPLRAYSVITFSLSETASNRYT